MLTAAQISTKDVPIILVIAAAATYWMESNVFQGISRNWFEQYVMLICIFFIQLFLYEERSVFFILLVILKVHIQPGPIHFINTSGRKSILGCMFSTGNLLLTGRCSSLLDNREHCSLQVSSQHVHVGGKLLVCCNCVVNVCNWRFSPVCCSLTSYY